MIDTKAIRNDAHQLDPHDCFDISAKDVIAMTREIDKLRRLSERLRLSIPDTIAIGPRMTLQQIARAEGWNSVVRSMRDALAEGNGQEDGFDAAFGGQNAERPPSRTRGNGPRSAEEGPREG